MLLDPEGVIAMLREQRKSDLAMVAIVAMAACSIEEIEAGANPWLVASERLESGASRFRERNRTSTRKIKPRGVGRPRDVLAWIDEASVPPMTAAKRDLFYRAPKIAERLAPMLRAVGESVE